MKVAGLFAGIGGFESGLALSGHASEVLCEIWEPARAVLQDKFPGIPCRPDVSKLTSLPRAIDLLVAGFPCQDLSQAGKTVGIDGRRSSLVQHVFRLLDKQKTRWVVLENVSFMLSLDRGRAMHTLAEAFEERGYRWAYRVVNSLAFIPQRRERVVFVATTSDIDPASILLTDDVNPPSKQTTLATHAHGFYWTEGIRGLGWAPDAVPTLKNGSTVGIASPPAILLPNGVVVTPDIRDAERLQGFPADWTAAAATQGRASVRWSLIGNAVTAPVAAWIGRKLKEPGSYDQSRDQPFDLEKRWPRAGRYDGELRRRVEIGAYPEWHERLPLADFLAFAGKPLSPRATAGFLGRTERGRLRFAPGFLDLLRAHLDQVQNVSLDVMEPMLIAAE